MHMHRREFITIWIRYLLLALLGAVSVFAMIKKQGPASKSCTAGNLCRSCSKASGCNLPEKM
jgi:hypothetical protein